MSRLDQLVTSWLELDRNETTRQEIKDLHQKGNREELERRLSKRGIVFGTAGLRAKMEAGFSRMNDLTVLQASQGLACYALNTVPQAASRGIVIGHDHRHNSERFAQLTAAAFVTKGFKVYHLGMVHTPMVPFSVDHLGAACGVMVTASHNPAQDNGYKVYWENGCQIIPPRDIGIAQTIEENLEPWTWDVDQLSTSALVTDVGSQLIPKYFDRVKAVLDSGKLANPVRFVYTPVHGVGLPFLQTAASLLGLGAGSVVTVSEQAETDPDFPTVKFPNPEEHGVLDLAMALGDQTGIDTILANDPDADRFTVAVRNSEGKWVQLTGNQIGALFAEYWLERYKREHGPDVSKLAMVNSTVSSQLLAHMAKKHGFEFRETLTGFKWIGNQAISLESDGLTVPFAFEEAIGYMFGVAHDKDGISAAYVFIQLLADLQSKGTSVLEKLEQIYQDVGYFEEHNSYYVVPDPAIASNVWATIGQYGMAHPDAISPTHVGDFDVKGWRDLFRGTDSTMPNFRSSLPKIPDQMITGWIAPKDRSGQSARFTVRGSGTEPKLKVYIEAQAASAAEAKALADEVWEVLAREWFKPEVSGLLTV